jgi:hypothetical protein
MTRQCERQARSEERQERGFLFAYFLALPTRPLQKGQQAYVWRGISRWLIQSDLRWIERAHWLRRGQRRVLCACCAVRPPRQHASPAKVQRHTHQAERESHCLVTRGGRVPLELGLHLQLPGAGGQQSRPERRGKAFSRGGTTDIMDGFELTVFCMVIQYRSACQSHSRLAMTRQQPERAADKQRLTAAAG